MPLFTWTCKSLCKALSSGGCVPCLSQISHISGFACETCSLRTAFQALSLLQWDFMDSELRNRFWGASGPQVQRICPASFSWWGAPGKESMIHPSARLTTTSWARCLMKQFCDEAERKAARTEVQNKREVIAKIIPSNSLATLKARLQHLPEKSKPSQP